jgi:membrane associated rhomboid family serine protease
MITLLIIIVTVIFSIKGFSDHAFFGSNVFEVEKVLIFKQYKRIFTSGFIHINWLHLIFNMLALFLFSSAVENTLGPVRFLLIYLTSLIGGNLLALLIHRNHGTYSALGASGAVNGIIFATIALFPYMRIGFFLLPPIPAWIFGLLYVGFSMYGIRSKKENVGHEAHLGGALIGMLLAILMEPRVLTTNYLPILAIMLPSLIFIYLIIYQPHVLMVNNIFYKKSRHYTADDHYNMGKALEQQEIDRILEKIHKKGMSSLTKEERQKLDRYSKIIK